MKEKERERFVELRASGLSYDKIREQIGVAKQTLVNWGRELDTQISELKASRLDEMVEKLLMAKERRVELFAEQLSRLRGELENRDLQEIGTPVLLRLYLQYLARVSREVEPTKVAVTIDDTMTRYESILMQCMKLPEGALEEDIPELAADLFERVTGRPKLDQK